MVGLPSYMIINCGLHEFLPQTNKDLSLNKFNLMINKKLDNELNEF